MTFWSTLTEELRAGNALFVAAVADHTRHSPGTRGAKMFVRADGSQHGTIGGGAMEASILDRAQSALAAGEDDTTLTTLHHRADADGERSGLICAGKQTMVYWVARPEQANVYADFVEAADRDEVELVVSNGEPGLRAASVGTSPPVRLDEDAYCEHAVNHRRAAIAGGGHCGLALSRTLAQLGYFVTVFDTRPNLFTLQQNVWADRQLIVDDFTEIGRHVRFPALTHCIVMTAGLPTDVASLLGLKDIDAPFKGVMGSSAKLSRIRKDLRDAGAGHVVEELFAPIGLPMTSNTPEEIAVSIAGQLLQLRNDLFPWERPSPL